MSALVAAEGAAKALGVLEHPAARQILLRGHVLAHFAHRGRRRCPLRRREQIGFVSGISLGMEIPLTVEFEPGTIVSIGWSAIGEAAQIAIPHHVEVKEEPRVLDASACEIGTSLLRERRKFPIEHRGISG